MNQRLLVRCTVLCLFQFLLFVEVSGQWKSLFNGKDLKGWNQKNGKAKYAVVNGEIVGTTVAKTPNSFLCTDVDYRT
jgi:Domain of Unknown Function (DUF1080)